MGSRGPGGKRDRRRREPEVTTPEPEVTWFGWETADRQGKGSQAQTTGSHVVWGGKTADQQGKRSAGSDNRKSRGLGWDTADRVGKRSVGSESKVQIKHRGRSLLEKDETKEDAMLENSHFFVIPFFYKSPKSKRLIVGGLGPREEEEEVLYVVGVPSTAPTIDFILL